MHEFDDFNVFRTKNHLSIRINRWINHIYVIFSTEAAVNSHNL